MDPRPNGLTGVGIKILMEMGFSSIRIRSILRRAKSHRVRG